MKTIEGIRDFLNPFIDWASDQPDVQGVALVGSYVRGAARDDSDIDLVILTDQPQKYPADLKWIERFGEPEKVQLEDYGRLQSLRVWYKNGVEVEYGITIKCAPNFGKTLLTYMLHAIMHIKSLEESSILLILYSFWLYL